DGVAGGIPGEAITVRSSRTAARRWAQAPRPGEVAGTVELRHVNTGGTQRTCQEVAVVRVGIVQVEVRRAAVQLAEGVDASGRVQGQIPGELGLGAGVLPGPEEVPRGREPGNERVVLPETGQADGPGVRRIRRVAEVHRNACLAHRAV